MGRLPNCCHFCKKGNFTSADRLREIDAEKARLGKEIDDETRKMHSELRGCAKVLDHCHATGTYRGAAHCACNLKYSTASLIKKIPVHAHNGNYDWQLIVQALAHPDIQRRVRRDKARGYRGFDLSAICMNGEKFKTLCIGPFQFVDSMSFIASSLDEALGYLADADKTSIRREANKRADALGMDREAMFEAFKCKQIFPYEGRWNDHLDEPITAKIEWFQSRLKNAYGKTPEEVEDNDNLDLARIAFGFNRRDYGRLRQLIDVLNGL